MTVTHTFNTGRLYSAEGQVISASFDPSTMMVKFVDHSRMVEGQYLTTLEIGWYDPVIAAQRIMLMYDHNCEPNSPVEHWIEGDRPQRQDKVHEIQL